MTDSLLLKITEGQNPDVDQNQPKSGQFDSCDQPQTKVLIKLKFAIHLNVLDLLHVT